MSRYRVQYAPTAQAALEAMDRSLRNSFEQGMRQLASDPYGHGSCAVKGEKDRRQAVVARVTITVYCLSPDPGILMVSVVRIARCLPLTVALVAVTGRLRPRTEACGGRPA